MNETLLRALMRWCGEEGNPMPIEFSDSHFSFEGIGKVLDIALGEEFNARQKCVGLHSDRSVAYHTITTETELIALLNWVKGEEA
jgi:hypothetical protein